MPRAALATGYFDEEDGLPPSRLINCLALPFQSPIDKNATHKITHVPGLGTAVESIAAACRGLWYDPNGIDTRLIGVFGTDFYTFDSSFNATDRGNVASSSRLAKMAASPTQLAILSGTTLYEWNGTTLTAVTDMDLPGVEDIAYLGGRFLAIDQTSHNVYYSDLDDLTSWTSVGFVEANYDADHAVAVVVDADDLFILGRVSGEIWGVTADSDNPYQRRLGAIIPKGCMSRDSVVRADNAIFFVADDATVCRLEGVTPMRVSDRWLEKKIEGLSEANQALIESQTFTWRGQTIVQVSLPGAGTWWLNCATREWNERATASATEAACRVWAQNRQKGGTGKAYGVLTAGGRTADLYNPSAEKFTDGASAITRTFTAFIGADQGGNAIDTIALTHTPGRIGTAGTPSWSLEISHNGGQSYDSALTRSFGTMGTYSEPTLWQGTGSIGEQGASLRFSTAAAAADDVIAVRFNEDQPFR